MHGAARDLTLEAAQAAGSGRHAHSQAMIRDLPFVQIKRLLDSRFDRDILDGLRKVISVGWESRCPKSIRILTPCR